MGFTFLVRVVLLIRLRMLIGSGVVTLSSGAAGSAQETGASGSGDSDSAISKGMSAVLGMTLISLVAAIAILV